MLNDGQGALPRLRLDLNLATLWSLPEWSRGPVGCTTAEQFAAIRAAGYEGVQSIVSVDGLEAQTAGLRTTGVARMLTVEDLEPIVAAHRTAGYQATTLIAGNGLESDSDVRRLAEAIVGQSARDDYPLFLETHRGTMTQDIRRTVDLLADVPDLRFTGDLSHWYVGHEFPLSDVEAKLAFIAPVLSRVRLIQGRLADAGAIQTPPAGREAEPFVDHFRRMWRQCFEGFLAEAGPGDVVVFAPELLPAKARFGDQTFQLDYARKALTASGTWREESDRWTDAAQLCDLARECFAAASAPCD